MFASEADVPLDMCFSSPFHADSTTAYPGSRNSLKRPASTLDFLWLLDLVHSRSPECRTYEAT